MDKAYVKMLQSNESAIREEYATLWKMAGEGYISPDQAQQTLEVLYKRSMLDILQKLPAYAEHYPTKQRYADRLTNVHHLWWVDHATAGVNGWGTLGWFSSKVRTHKKRFKTKESAEAYAERRKGKVQAKDGKYYVTWKGYAGACTHFVVFANGLPFMVLPLTHGCWGEPKRNGDGIHIEMVNALICRLKGTDWYFWAGKLPQKVLDVQQPEHLEQPFRGATAMLPYTWQQVITNIKLKRLCIAATTEKLDQDDVELTPRMALDRMSQHTDWRDSKFDMGPLWPFDLCNKAAFENYPIESYSFMQNFVLAPDADLVVDPEELKALEASASDEDTDHDLWDADETIDSTKEVQEALIKIYGKVALPKYGVDGHMGKETTTAVRHFQENWNLINANDRIKIDGIPGIQTCARLEKAIEAGGAFRTMPF